MAERHFSSSYRKHVAGLIKTHPLDEAMSLAVGGDYDRIGAMEADLLNRCGLTEAMSIVDLGCGSGRLAKPLGQRMPKLRYLGVDIVPDLIRYAEKQCPPHFRFLINADLRVPAADASCDFVAAFSLFTHLHLIESYAYMRDIKRVLKPGGALVMSFLEVGTHWPVLRGEIEAELRDPDRPITSFLERSVVETLAKDIGFASTEIVPSNLGQTVACLRS